MFAAPLSRAINTIRVFMQTESDTQRRLALTAGFLLVLGVASGLLGHAQTHWWMDTVWTLVTLATTLVCFQTARGLRGRERRVWLFIGLAATSWLAGQLVWDYLELVAQETTPFPALSDIGYLATAPLLAVGLLYYTEYRPNTALTLKLASDFGILFVAMVAACIVIFYQPLEDPAIPRLYKITALGYPVLYISAFLFTLLLLLQRAWIRRARIVTLIVVSLGVQAMVNTLYARSLLTREYEVGNYLDVFWVLAFVCIYWAAFEARRPLEPREARDLRLFGDRLRRIEFLLPTLVFAFLLVLLWQYAPTLDAHIWTYLLPLGLLLTSLFGVREWALQRVETRLADEARASEREVNAILETMLDTFYRTDRQGRIVRVSPAVQALLGYTPEELINRTLMELYVHPEQRAIFLAEMQRHGGAIKNYETSLRHKDGSTVWVATSAHVLRDENSEVIGVEGTTRDITERKRAEAEMAKLSSALEQTADLVMITDRTGVIEYVNSAFVQVTGFSREETLGRKPSLLKSGSQEAESYRILWETVLRGDNFSNIMINRKKDGSLYYESKSIAPLRNRVGHITHFVSTGKDITEQMLAQEKLQYLAHHDALTTLPNRTLLLDRLQQSLARARRHERKVALLFMDLDRFKTINDSLGHEMGDRLLQEVGTRLRSSLRDGDTIARHGGDEFVLLLEDVASENDIALIAQEILHALAPPFRIGGHALHITASIGISYFPADGENSRILLRNADIAMYRAKDTGKNNFKFYTEEMSARAVERLALENNLRFALERGEFSLHYQPQVDVATGAVIGAEALLRWNSPASGPVSPVEFIPLLEETGLILPVGAWVLREACLQLRRWQRDGRPWLRMAVNLSGRQFDDQTLPGLIRALVAETGIDPATLDLEMTESVLMRQSALVNETLTSLSQAGLRLAIDDFGTGYSSLSYLKRFPIDILKIDRSFMSDVTSDTDDAHIVTAILGMGASLDLEVIAEGVETVEQREFLRTRGCRVMQGYLFARPMSAADFDLLLAREPAGSAGRPALAAGPQLAG